MPQRRHAELFSHQHCQVLGVLLRCLFEFGVLLCAYWPSLILFCRSDRSFENHFLNGLDNSYFDCKHYLQLHTVVGKAIACSGGVIISTGHAALRATSAVLLPKNARLNPLLPCVLITIRSTSLFSANRTIALPGSISPSNR